MIASGVPMIQAMGILSRQQTNRTFRRALLRVLKDVESGSTLSSAMTHHKEVFDSLYVSLISAGEESGEIEKILIKFGLILFA